MSLPIYPFSEPITEPEILESIRKLPTEDDLPCDDGEPMETPRHRDQMNVLIESLKVHWSERSGYYVGGNMFVHYDPTNTRRSRGPDFFLVLDVDDRERKSWVVWREGMRFPDVIIELLSDSTRAIDKGEKSSSTRTCFAPRSTICTTRSAMSSSATGSRAWTIRKLCQMPRAGCIRR
jgi:Uma2 family endonuclease